MTTVVTIEKLSVEINHLSRRGLKSRRALLEDAKKGVICQNLEEVVVMKDTEVLDIMSRGIKQRQ